MKTSRSRWVTSLLMCSLSASALSLEQPNILILMAEDMSSRVGAFGDEVAVTPNLDRLAQQSVRYTNTYTAAGVCAPSRTAHITGMHQISVGGQHMRSSQAPMGGYKAVPPVAMKAYPELLRAAGYYTWTDNKLDYQFSGTQAGTGPFTIWNHEGSDGHWRNREDGQPFFGLMNFNVTHESGVMTQLGSWPESPMHLLIQLVRAATMPDVETGSPVAPSQVILPPYYPDTELVRAGMTRHYNNIHAMDVQVGEVLAERRAGLTSYHFNFCGRCSIADSVTGELNFVSSAPVGCCHLKSNWTMVCEFTNDEIGVNERPTRTASSLDPSLF